MSFALWYKWLLVVSLGVSAFGIFMALVSGTPLFEIFNRQSTVELYVAESA